MHWRLRRGCLGRCTWPRFWRCVPRCRCCLRRKQLNAHRLCGDCAVCLHCEKHDAVTELGLCESCHETPHICDLYRRSQHWTPEWEMHLRRKTAEVQEKLRRLRQRGQVK